MMKDEDKQTEEIKNGIFETFHENGQLASRENYKDGELDGPWEWFYENGQLMTRATFINGKKEGLLESFHSNGQLQMTENYKDNELDGLVEEFEENGKLSIRENYKDGVLQDENDEQTDDTATETTDAAPKGKMVKLQKVKLSETQLTLWEVEFTVDKSYDKKNYIAEEARKHFKSIADNLEPDEFEENSDESDEDWYLFSTFSYYACDGGHGGNVVNDCLVAMSDDGIRFGKVHSTDKFDDYEYKFHKLDISHDQEYIPMGLSTYGNNLKVEDGFLIGECLSEFIDNCSCKDCS